MENGIMEEWSLVLQRVLLSHHLPVFSSLCLLDYSFSYFISPPLCPDIFWVAGTSLFPFGITRKIRYEWFSDVPESWVGLRADFQSGSRVLKKVFWTFSYLYLWHTMWFHAEKLQKTLKFLKSINSLYKSGSQPQKSQKYFKRMNFLIGMVYFAWYLVNPHVQTVQNMYGKGG